jgi:hypothetical protein
MSGVRSDIDLYFALFKNRMLRGTLGPKKGNNRGEEGEKIT